MAGIFKAYDIRGLVPEQINPERARRIGRAIGQWLGGGEVLVSQDMRTHSPDLAEALMEGIRDSGCDVCSIGLAATPMNYWANVNYGMAGSVSVTASHNPGEYNGFKISRKGAVPVGYDTGIAEIERLVTGWEAGSGPPPPVKARGQTRRIEGALDAYMDDMVGHLVPIRRPLKIAVDCANAMGGHFIGGLFERRPELTPVPLFWDLDGTFPNHEADPLKAENIAPVADAVRRERCDFGAALDGDADRCMFVDESGKAIASDLLTALLAENVLHRHPGATILYDLRSSKIVPETVRALGGTAVRGRVGHAFMKALMREKGAQFGGELSGHYYFAECSNTDSGLMALITVINRLQEDTRPLSAQVEPLRRYHATGEVNFRVRDTGAVLSAVEAFYAKAGGETDHLDGLTVTFADWWFNVRPSNTEPLLRLNLEADTRPVMETRLAEVKATIEAGA
jgi:phosphomannomutase